MVLVEKQEMLDGSARYDHEVWNVSGEYLVLVIRGYEEGKAPVRFITVERVEFEDEEMNATLPKIYFTDGKYGKNDPHFEVAVQAPAGAINAADFEFFLKCQQCAMEDLAEMNAALEKEFKI